MQKICTSASKSTLLLALLMLVGVFSTHAHAAEPAVYSLEEFDLGMDPLIGGTETIGNGSYSKDYYMGSNYGIAAPFTFYMYDRTITTSGAYYAHPNGFVTASTSSFSYGYSYSSESYWTVPKAMSDSATIDYTMYLFWDDLNYYHSPAGKIQYKAEGTAPNRKLIIEYWDIQRKGPGVCSTCYTTGGETGKLRGQVHIYEGTNIIEFRYADAAGGMDWASPMKATIGISAVAPYRDYGVTVAHDLETAPQSNYRFLPQFWSKWTGGGNSTSFTTASNWTSWNGSAVAPYDTSATGSNSRYFAYIPDTSALAFKPAIATGNYFSAGMIVDAGGEFSMSGGTLSLIRKGNGQLDNKGTVTLTGDAILKVQGKLFNSGTLTATGGNTKIVLNGTSLFSVQEVLFGANGSFGNVEVADGGDANNPTRVVFLDFNANRFTTLSNEEGTFLQFAGNLDISAIDPNALAINGGIGFTAGNGDTNVKIGNSAKFGPVIIENEGINKMTIEGSFKADSVNFIGAGDFVVTGYIDSKDRVSFETDSDINIGGDLTIGKQALLMNLVRNVFIGGKISTVVGDFVDINITSKDKIEIGGGINCLKGIVTLGATNDINVGGLMFADRGIIIDDAKDVTLGTPGMNALSSNDNIDFSGIDTLRVVGNIDHPGIIIFNTNTQTTIEGDLKAEKMSLLGPGGFQFDGDVDIGVFDSQTNASLNIGGDFGIKADVIDNNGGTFNVAGKVRLKPGAARYTLSFTNRSLVASGLVAAAGADAILGGKVVVSGTGAGNIAFDIEPTANVRLADDLKVTFAGAGEGIATFRGNVSTFTGGGAARPTFSGGTLNTHRAGLRFVQGSNTNIDGLILNNFGNLYATNAVTIESGAIVSNLSNLSILNSAVASAVLKINTGAMPAKVNAFEISGTSPHSIDASSVANFQVVFSQGPNGGGNLFGAGYEIDPQAVIIWEGGTPMSITTGATLPRAPKTVPYSIELQTVGGNAPFTWSFDAGTKPNSLSWLNIDTNTGRLFGTPPAIGPTGQQPPITVIVKDATPAGTPVSKSFNIIIDPIPGNPLQIDNTSLNVGFEGLSYFDSLVASGGSESGYTYTHTSGNLPPGVSLDPDFVNNGAITGTPDFGSTGGYSLGFTVTDGNSNSSPVKFLTLTIAAGTPRPVFTTVTLPDATVGVAYSFQLRAGNATAPYEFYVTDAARNRVIDQAAFMPSGMQMTDNGLIHGRPEAVGPQAFYVTVKDAFGVPSAQALLMTLEVKPLDLGPVSIDGGNSHGNGGSCALNGQSNLWLALFLVLSAGTLVAIRRRRA